METSFRTRDEYQRSCISSEPVFHRAQRQQTIEADNHHRSPPRLIGLALKAPNISVSRPSSAPTAFVVEKMARLHENSVWLAANAAVFVEWTTPTLILCPSHMSNMARKIEDRGQQRNVLYCHPLSASCSPRRRIPCKRLAGATISSVRFQWVTGRSRRLNTSCRMP